MTATDNASTDFGANAWLVDEMYEQYRADPASVSESWQEFFADYKPAHIVATPRGPGAACATPPAPAAPPRRPRPPRHGRCARRSRCAGDARRRPGQADPRRRRWPSPPTWSAASTCPTATSFRNVPAKLLEVNRKVINGYRSRTGQGKVSFTHLIGYAIVRAIADDVPAMNNAFVEGADGKPRLVRHEHVSMALAVDVDKGDGQRTLVAPGHPRRRHARLRRLPARRTRTSSARSRPTSSPSTTSRAPPITLTNPGTIGTVQTVPRLMPGQGVIVGVGSIDYPAEFQGADERTLADARRVQGRHDHQHLRPPHHPGRRDRPVPQARPRAAARRATASTTTSSPASACRTRPCSGAPTSTRSPAKTRCCTSRCRSPRSSASTACAATSSPTSIRCAGRSRRCPPSSTRPPTG